MARRRSDAAPERLVGVDHAPQSVSLDDPLPARGLTRPPFGKIRACAQGVEDGPRQYDRVRGNALGDGRGGLRILDSAAQTDQGAAHRRVRVAHDA